MELSSSASGSAGSAGSEDVVVGFISGSDSSSGSGATESRTPVSSSSSSPPTEAPVTFDTIFKVSKFDAESATVAVDDDYCRYNATETEKTGCKKPRTCRACLRVAGCMIGADAQCLSMAQHYNMSTDFRCAKIFKNDSLDILTSYDYWNTSTNGTKIEQNWVFPAMMVDYCGSDDPACELCRETVFRNSSTAGDMRFCVGTAGCVCVDRCDGPYHDAELLQQTICIEPPFKRALSPALMWVIGSSVTFLVCCGLFYWIYTKTRQPKDDLDDDRMDITFAKDGNKQGSNHPETPVMELSVQDFPRFSIDSSRRHGMFALSHQGDDD